MTKAKLKEYKWVRKNIESLESTLAEIRMKAECQTPTLSDMPKSQGDKDKVSSLVALIMDTEQMIAEKLHQSYVLLTDIEKAIEPLPEREKLLMRLRYIHFKTWEQIAVEMKYSWPQIHQIHAATLRIMGCEKDKTKSDTHE